LGTRGVRIVTGIGLQKFDGAVEVGHLGHLIADEFDSVTGIEGGIGCAKLAVGEHHGYWIGSLHVELLKKLLQGSAGILGRGKE